jgi:predicted nucleic acid-binding protein
MTYALDTNILSYMLRRDAAVCGRYLAESRAGHECVIPPVAYYEIKRGLMAVNATAKEWAFDLLCQDFGIGEMSTSAWLRAASLYAINRQNGRAMDDADLFIAAFCIENGHTLVTNNVRHFDGVEGLRLVNWAEPLGSI